MQMKRKAVSFRDAKTACMRWIRNEWTRQDRRIDVVDIDSTNDRNWKTTTEYQFVRHIFSFWLNSSNSSVQFVSQPYRSTTFTLTTIHIVYVCTVDTLPMYNTLTVHNTVYNNDAVQTVTTTPAVSPRWNSSWERFTWFIIIIIIIGYTLYATATATAISRMHWTRLYLV